MSVMPASQNFQIFGQQNLGYFMVSNDTERTTEHNLSVWDG